MAKFEYLFPDTVWRRALALVCEPSETRSVSLDVRTGGFAACEQTIVRTERESAEEVCGCRGAVGKSVIVPRTSAVVREGEALS